LRELCLWLRVSGWIFGTIKLPFKQLNSILSTAVVHKRRGPHAIVLAVAFSLANNLPMVGSRGPKSCRRGKLQTTMEGRGQPSAERRAIVEGVMAKTRAQHHAAFI
jgi:hypothetical protein